MYVGDRSCVCFCTVNPKAVLHGASTFFPRPFPRHAGLPVQTIIRRTRPPPTLPPARALFFCRLPVDPRQNAQNFVENVFGMNGSRSQ